MAVSFFARSITQNSLTTPKVRAVMIPAAASSPSRMAGMASRRRMSSTEATSAPVQAPVPGRGIPTRIARPSSRYFRTKRPFR